jgi:DNA-binding NtrC family response regulator
MKRTCMLFVGSDQLLGAVMVATLEDIGYEARAETEPRKVLRDFAKEPGSLDGVILECAMPDLDGPELAKRLSVIRPDLPMILLTGCPETGSEKRTVTIHNQVREWCDGYSRCCDPRRLSY